MCFTTVFLIGEKCFGLYYFSIYLNIIGCFQHMCKYQTQQEIYKICRKTVECAALPFFFFFRIFYRSSSALHRRFSTQILPDYWGTFCAGVCPKSVFSFLVAAGFEPTSLSLRSVYLNRYPILTPLVCVVR